MKAQNLHLNQSKLIDDMMMRDKVYAFIENADLQIIKALGFIMLDKTWEDKELEEDLGSYAIEKLLAETDSIDYIELKKIYENLKENKLIK
jgi:hypothetical protein